MGLFKTILISALFWAGGLDGAALPNTLNYQGRMRLSSGAAVADSNSNQVYVAIYNVASGGSPLWAETLTNVTTVNGLFNVVLGKGTPLALPFDQPYWLGVNFNGDGEMTPRSELTMGPYAFRAGVATVADTATVAESVNVPLNLTHTGTNSTLFAENSSGAGIGIYGAGITGVAGVANANGGTGILASSGGWANGLGLHSFGNSLFDGIGNTATFSTYVSFTAGTNLSVGDAASIRGRNVATLTPANGDVYAWNGTDWSPGSINTKQIDGHAVMAATPNIDEVLSYNGSQWVNGPINAKKLDGQMLSASFPMTDDVLTYNGSQWTNGSANAKKIDGLMVSANFASIGNVLTYDGSQWVSGGADAKKIDGQMLSASFPMTDDVLTYNGSQWMNGSANAKKLDGQMLSASFPMTDDVLTYNGSQWVNGSANAKKLDGQMLSASFPMTDDVLTYNGSQWVNGEANAKKLQGKNVANVAPSNGQILTWNSGFSVWEPASPAAVSAPLALTASVSSSGSVLFVNQSQNTFGGAAIVAHNSASNTAAVLGISTDTTVPGPATSPGVGVHGLGPVGVLGSTNLMDGIGIVGSVSTTANGGAIFGFNDGAGDGVAGESSGGVGVRGHGVTGVAGATSHNNGIAVAADSNGMPGALALYARGDARFDGTGNTTTFNTFVNFAGGTNLSGGVSAPLSLTNNTTVSTLFAANSSAGSAVFGLAANSIVGSGVVGSTSITAPFSATNKASVYGYTNVGESVGVLGLNSYGSGVGVLGAQGPQSPFIETGQRIGVMGSSSYWGGNAIGVYGNGLDQGVVGSTDGLPSNMTDVAGVIGYSVSGIGVIAQGSSAGLSAQGSLYAISATATGATGQAVLGFSSSSNPTAQFINAGSGSGVLGQINTRGNDGRAGVQAKNTLGSAVGSPAAALDLDGGISFNAAKIGGGGGRDVPAGVTISTAVDSGSLSVVNEQITPASIIILTMQQAAGPPAGATLFIASISNGQASVQFNGWGATNHKIHYMIMNPR